MAVFVATGLAPATTAAPGHAAVAGVPEDPVPVHVEDFEHGVGTTLVPLPDYVGVTGQTYTADPAWRIGCNGMVLRITGPLDQPGDECADIPYVEARQVAHVLGVYAGLTAVGANAAFSAVGGGAPGVVQLETRTPIALGRSGRFVTVVIDAATATCASQWRLYVLDGTTQIPVSAVPADPCAAPGYRQIEAPAVGTMPGKTFWAGSPVGDDAALVAGATVGVRVRHEQGGGAGLDNVRVLDATPRLDASFGPAAVDVGQASTLTFTVTNTSDLASKRGWSFTNVLPDGLVVADPAGSSTTCPNGAITVPPGDGSVAPERESLNFC